MKSKSKEKGEKKTRSGVRRGGGGRGGERRRGGGGGEEEGRRGNSSVRGCSNADSPVLSMATINGFSPWQGHRGEGGALVVGLGGILGFVSNLLIL